MDNNIINNNDIIYNYLDICNMLETDESTIREWCNFFKDLIEPKSHNMVRQFDTDDVKKLAFIKHLIVDKKMSLTAAHKYCVDNGFEDSNSQIIILNNKDFMQEFAKIMLSKMDSRFDSLEQTLNKNSKDINELKANTDNLQCNLTNIYEGISNANRQDIKSYIDNNTKIVSHFASNNSKEYMDLKNDVKTTIEICNNVMKEVKMISRVERHKKQSLFYKLFHKD